MLICFYLKSFIFSSAFVDTVCSQCFTLNANLSATSGRFVQGCHGRCRSQCFCWILDSAGLCSCLSTGSLWSPKPGARGLLREPIWLSLYRGCGKDCWSRTGFECWVGGPPPIFCAFQIFQVFLLCTCLQFFSRSQSYSLQIFTSNWFIDVPLYASDCQIRR